MKQKIEDILEETGYKESRAAKMDLNDILKYVRAPSSLMLSDDSFADYYQLFMTRTSISPDRYVMVSPPHCINYHSSCTISLITLHVLVLSVNDQEAYKEIFFHVEARKYRLRHPRSYLGLDRFYFSSAVVVVLIPESLKGLSGIRGEPTSLSNIT